MNYFLLSRVYVARCNGRVRLNFRRMLGGQRTFTLSNRGYWRHLAAKPPLKASEAAYSVFLFSFFSFFSFFSSLNRLLSSVPMAIKEAGIEKCIPTHLQHYLSCYPAYQSHTDRVTISVRLSGGPAEHQHTALLAAAKTCGQPATNPSI